VGVVDKPFLNLAQEIEWKKFSVFTILFREENRKEDGAFG